MKWYTGWAFQGDAGILPALPITGSWSLGSFQSLELYFLQKPYSDSRPERPAVDSPGQRPGLPVRENIRSPEGAMENSVAPTGLDDVVGFRDPGRWPGLSTSRPFGPSESCRALVLISSTARFCATDGYEHGLAEANLRAMQRSLGRDPRGTLENFHKLCAAPATLSADELAARVEASLSLGIETLAAGLQKLRETDLRERVGEVRCPVLLLHGEEDRVIPVGASRWLAAKIPDAKLVTLAGAGHDLPIRHAGWVADEVRKFIGALA